MLNLQLCLPLFLPAIPLRRPSTGHEAGDTEFSTPLQVIEGEESDKAVMIL